ncbi:MAG: hypothetical protein JW940_34695 [Polyangiaceae bacterium]|nr:hypothetical protein [Polyangiaceae bacterium]
MRQQTDKKRAWTGVLARLSAAALVGAVALGPGCGLGGWTGDSTGGHRKEEDVPSLCSDENIAYEQHSVQGESAEELMARYGRTYLGTSTAVSDGFWEGVGLDVESSPVALELRLSYADGEVLENTCTPRLSVVVQLNAKLGDGLAEWQVPAKLELTSGDVTLSALLPAGASVSSVDLGLGVAFDTQTAAAELSPVSGPTGTTAEFLLQ